MKMDEKIVSVASGQLHMVAGVKSTYTQASKLAIYKWRETHKDKFRAYENKWAIKNYHNNSEKYKKYARSKYHYEKEANIFRNILLI
jgi:hypothetical protein